MSAMPPGFEACLRGTGPLYNPYAAQPRHMRRLVHGRGCPRRVAYGEMSLSLQDTRGRRRPLLGAAVRAGEKTSRLGCGSRTNFFVARSYSASRSLGTLVHYVYNTAMEIDQLMRDTRPAYALNPATWASVAYTLQRWEEAGIAEYDDATVERVRGHFRHHNEHRRLAAPRAPHVPTLRVPVRGHGLRVLPRQHRRRTRGTRVRGVALRAIESQFVVDTTRRT